MAAASLNSTSTLQPVPTSISVKEFVNIDALKGKLNVREFVERLSAPIERRPSTGQAIASRSNGTQASQTPSSALFDPKPYIRIYESAVDELLKIKRKTQSKVDDLLDQEAAAEKSTKQKIKTLLTSFDEVQSAFDALEGRLNVVANTAVRIGEQLETIDRQRQRGTDAIDLIQYFVEFNQGKTKRLDELRKSGTDGEYKSVVIAKRLNAIAKEVDTVGTEAGRENIEKYCEDLERSILDSFDKALRKGNKSNMQRCASMLYDFNGGNSCVQIYINQIPLFINRKDFETETDFLQSLESHGTTDEKWVQIPKADPSLLGLYDDIRETCSFEWSVISEVFPNSKYVMQQLVQRIFAQSIQNHVETLLSAAQNHSLLTYLRALASSYTATVSLVSDLRKFDDEIISPKVGSPALTAVLDRSLEDLFVPYFEGDSYVEAESKCLLLRFEKILTPFCNFVCERAKALQKRGIKTGIYMLPSISAQVREIAAANTGLTSVMNAFNSLVVGEHTSFVQSNSNRTPDEMGIPTVETLLKLLVPHIETLTRCKQLVSVHTLPMTAHSFFMTLIQFQPYYLESALIMAIEDFQQGSSHGQEPDLRALQIANVGGQILQLIQIHFQNCVVSEYLDFVEEKVPLLVSSPPVHRETVMYKNQFMETMEGRIAELIQKQVDAALAYLLAILNKQKKTDYKPKDEPNGLGISCTPTCVQASDFLRRVSELVHAHMDGENVGLMLVEIGNGFHRMLLDHFKKFQVSHSGGLILTKDISKYQETITLFNITSLNERFEMLREIGNIFIVRPENLKTVFNEGYLSQIELSLLHPYVSMRADWGRLSKFEQDIFTKNMTSPIESATEAVEK